MTIAEPVNGTSISTTAFGIPVARLLNGFFQNAVGTCSAALTLTTSAQDVPGCTVSVAVVGSNAHVIVTANAQFACTTASAGHNGQCTLLVDGVSQAALGSIKDSTDQVHDQTRSFTWKIPLTAGTHTLKLQGQKDNATPVTAITNTFGSNIVVQVYDLP